MKETAIQRQKVENEADEMRAEHLKSVSSVKAELTAKIRQLKVFLIIINHLLFIIYYDFLYFNS